MELNSERSNMENIEEWVNTRQCSISSPLQCLYKQPANHEGPKSFIYADDFCITAQEDTFEEVEGKLEAALNILSSYYKENCLRANPETT